MGLLNKPHYNPDESQVKKEFDDFDLFSTPKQPEEEQIHLDLDYGKQGNPIEEVKQAVEGDHHQQEDLLDFDNEDLINIGNKKDDNLIDFGSNGNNHQKMPHPGHRFPGHHHMGPSHSMHGGHVKPLEGVPFPNTMYSNHNAPPTMPHPIFSTGALGSHHPHSNSLPRKPNPGMFNTRSSQSKPAKPNTEDFFQF